MKNYKVQAVYDGGFMLTAVVACRSESEAIAIAGFSGGEYSEQKAKYIGESTYTKPTLICAESF